MSSKYSAQQIAYSKTLVTLVKDSIPKANDAIDAIKLDNDQNKIVLLDAANNHSVDLQHILYELRKTVTNHIHHHESDQDLIYVIQSLAEVINHLQQLLSDDDVERTKQEFKTDVGKAILVADALEKYIENTKSEDDLNKVVRTMDDLVTGLQKIVIRGRLEKLKTEEIIKEMNSTKAKKIAAFAKIDVNNKHIMQELNVLCRRVCEQLRTIGENLDETAYDCEGRNQECLLQLASTISKAVNNIISEICNHEQDPETFKHHVHIYIVQQYKLIDYIVELVGENSTVPAAVRNTVVSAVTAVLAAAELFTRRLEKLAAEN